MKSGKWKMENGSLPLWAYTFLLFPLLLFSQGPSQVSTSVDTTAIKVGEQVKFTVTVEADSTAAIIFPEGQTFSPLETVEAYKIDTVKKRDRVTLQRTYALTQWDSGVYKLPPQRIEINGQGYMTDSLQITVANVKVDTLTQKMYDIKELMEVEKSHGALWRALMFVVLGLASIGGLLYWFVFRKKPLSETEKEALLPPYDRALLELKRLENSKYLIQDEYKQYYSELTDIVRSYLEEDVHISALESTTDQLIDRLEMLKDAGELPLEDGTLKQFKHILQTADLVKFAKSKPGTSIAEQDRKAIEQIVIKTHEVLPEPTEEELMQQQEYLEELAKAKKRKRLIIAGVSLGVLFFLGTIGAVAFYGFNKVKDSLLGHPTKELLEGEWVASSYGYPPIAIETPKVLVRREAKLPAEAKAIVKEMQVFNYNSLIGLFEIVTSSVLYVEEVEPDYQATIDFFMKNWEANGVKNILTKEEEFTTTAGVKGLKVYGSGKFPLPNTDKTIDGQYVLLLFGGKGFLQQVAISWPENDDYAQQVVNRILNSVDVKTNF
ncbi:MAG: BatD family protein [Flavobacteriaceae bacterium]